MPPVLFLDIDGVLTTRTSRREGRRRKTFPTAFHRKLTQLDRDLVGNLDAIYARTGCDTVISSQWRVVFDLPELRAMLHVAGFSGPIVGRTPKPTPEDNDRPRWRDIQMWLQEHEPGADFCETWLRKVEPTTRFCVLDDNKDTGPFFSNWVLTKDKYGLEKQHVKRAVEILTA